MNNFPRLSIALLSITLIVLTSTLIISLLPHDTKPLPPSTHPCQSDSDCQQIFGFVCTGSVPGTCYTSYCLNNKCVTTEIQPPSPTASISSWKTFQGYGYTYTLNHPPNFQVSSVKNVDTVLTDKGVKVLSISWEKTDKKTVKEYSEGFGMFGFTKVAGYEAIVWANDVPNTQFEAYSLVNNGLVYYINNHSFDNVFPQILSTFKFSDQSAGTSCAISGSCPQPMCIPGNPDCPPPTMCSQGQCLPISQVEETDPSTYCSTNSGCWCRSFTGSRFIPGEKVIQTCNTKSNRCPPCYYE